MNEVQVMPDLNFPEVRTLKIQKSSDDELEMWPIEKFPRIENFYICGPKISMANSFIRRNAMKYLKNADDYKETFCHDRDRFRSIKFYIANVLQRMPNFKLLAVCYIDKRESDHNTIKLELLRLPHRENYS
uniref:Uncharacterized protein n=1 Tax=Glossina austeni TaxID=7395 RepID=A0A1A9UU92_GLOAU